MKRNLALFLVLILLFPALACAVSTDDIAAQVKAFQQFVQLRTAKEQDMVQIQKLYTENLASLFTASNKLVPGLKSEVEKSLAAAEKSKFKAPDLHVVEKGCQVAFVNLMKDYLNKTEKSYKQTKPALNNLKIAKAYYGGLESTAKRRGDYIGSPNTFVDQFNFAFTALEKAISSKDGKMVSAAKNEIFNLIAKIYVLTVIYEVDGITDNRGKDDNYVLEKIAEGKTYFKILKPIAKDAKAALVIEKEFAKAPADINVGLMKENLKYAFPEVAAEFKNKF